MADLKKDFNGFWNGLPSFVRVGFVTGIIVFVVILLVMLYKWLSSFIKRPNNVPISPDTQGTGSGTTSITALLAGIYQDMTGWFQLRNRGLYTQLLALSNSQLDEAWNDWKNNTQYYSRGSLPIAIANQSSFWDAEFGQQQTDLAARFQSLGLT